MKKPVCLLILLVLPAVFFLSSCAAGERFDYSELNLRLKKRAPEFVFSEERLFLANGVWYAWYGEEGEETMLLTMREDEEKNLDRLTLALCRPTPGNVADFIRLASVLTEIFIPNAAAEEIGDAVGFTSPEVVTGDVLRQWKKGFYRAVLWGSDLSPVLVLEYSVA